MILGAILVYILDKKLLYQLIVTLSTFLILKLAHFFRQRQKRFNLFKYYKIPGPEPNLIDGNHGEAFANDAIFLNVEKWAKKYGNWFGYFIGDDPVIVVKDLDKLKKVFFDEVKVFSNRAETYLRTAISEGILFAEDEKWRLMRKVLSPTFSAFTINDQASTKFIEDSVDMLVNYIDKKIEEEAPQNIDIQSLLQATSLQLVSALALKLPGLEVKEKEKNVESLNEYLSSYDSKYFVFVLRFPFIKPIIQSLYDRIEYMTFVGEIHRKVNSMIDKELVRLKKGEGDVKDKGNPMKSLIKLYHGRKLSRIEVLGNAESILAAGYETTSTTLSYILWTLSKHVAVQERLREELFAHGVESKYLEQVIKETMRLYPTVTIFTTRRAGATIRIDDDLTVPEGARVSYDSWLFSRDPELWEEPESFKPERFDENSNYHPCAYAPFGLSERRCLGLALAMFEMKMILCNLLLRFKLNLRGPQELELKTSAVILTAPREKISLEFEKLTRIY